MIYQQFKTVAYKFKYETAIETESERITYGELLQRSATLYNSFFQLGIAGKTVAVFTNNCPETVYAVLAASRAGARCVICRVSGPLKKIKETLSVYRPSVAIVHACHLGRISPALAGCGCHCAVTVGRAQDDSIPSLYTLADLMEINDYNTVAPQEGEGSVVLANDGVHWDVTERIAALPAREGVFLSLPLYCGAGFDALWQTLMTGHKCVICDIPTKGMLRRKKVSLCLVYEGEDSFGIDAEYYSNPDTYCINREFMYKAECEDYLSESTGYPVDCTFDGKRLRITLTLNSDSDIEAVKDSPLSHALSGYCADTFYGMICRKSVVFKKNI